MARVKKIAKDSTKRQVNVSTKRSDVNSGQETLLSQRTLSGVLSAYSSILMG